MSTTTPPRTGADSAPRTGDDLVPRTVEDTTPRTFEDLALQSGADPSRVGPVVVTRAELAAYGALTGETHPLHDADGAAVLPASLLHARSSGAVVAAAGPLAVAGLRSMQWRCLHRVVALQPWWIESRVTQARIVTDQLGVVLVERRLLADDGTLLAIGQLELALERSAR